MKSIVDTYLTYLKKYIKIYGKNTVVLMGVGKFYEIFSFDKNDPEFVKIGTLLNLGIFHKNYNGLVYYGIGFPKQISDKYYKQLIDDAKYVVVTIDENKKINICSYYGIPFDDNNSEENESDKEEIITITI